MAAADYHSEPYIRQLNEWHGELSMLRDLCGQIFHELEGPEWVCSAAHIAGERLSHLIETLPFPPTTESIT